MQPYANAVKRRTFKPQSIWKNTSSWGPGGGWIDKGKKRRKPEPTRQHKESHASMRAFNRRGRNDLKERLKQEYAENNTE